MVRKKTFSMDANLALAERTIAAITEHLQEAKCIGPMTLLRIAHLAAEVIVMNKLAHKLPGPRGV